MRRYTTFSFVLLSAFFVVLTVVPLYDTALWLPQLLVGALATVYCFFWERRPPAWLAVATIAGTSGLWSVSVALGVMSFAALFAALAVALPVSQLRRYRIAWSVAALGLLLAPVGLVAARQPGADLWPYVIAGFAAWFSAFGIFFLNRYTWNLYLQIDEARRMSAQLAVAQERYRFATDLHDIQGHTLHVIRLKTQLAARLMKRDPDIALAHLAEADELIGETLANTRSLAFGDRTVSLASELANAKELFAAAGIDWKQSGSVGIAGPHDELLGLVAREATTNILRHAQANAVIVTVAPGWLSIANDGSPASMGPLSGLARLAERFAAAGGTLTTSSDGGVFTTEARLR